MWGIIYRSLNTNSGQPRLLYLLVFFANRALQLFSEFFIAFTHPAVFTCQFIHHQDIGGNIFCDYRACADEHITAYCMTADDVVFGGQRCSIFNKRVTDLIPFVDFRSWL